MFDTGCLSVLLLKDLIQALFGSDDGLRLRKDILKAVPSYRPLCNGEHLLTWPSRIIRRENIVDTGAHLIVFGL